MVGVAIVGYGYWGPNLARNFDEAEGTRVEMICDQDPQRLAKARRRHPAAEGTTRFEDVLNNPRVQAVAIATPVQTHYDLARRAIEAGKHVLVEKPLTMRADHAEDLCKRAKKKGVVLMVDHIFVFSPAVVQLKQIVDSGKLGDIFFIDGVRINLGLFQHDVNVVWDLAPHDISIVDLLLQRLPLSLSAFGSTHANDQIEDVAYLNLDYGGGLIANFHVNWLSPVKVRQMIIGGSKRSLIYNDLDASEKIKVYDRGISVAKTQEERHKVLISYRSGDIWAPNVPTIEPLSRMTSHFADCIRRGKDPITNGQAGLRIVRILEAAQRSIKAQGRRITL